MKCVKAAFLLALERAFT